MADENSEFGGLPPEVVQMFGKGNSRAVAQLRRLRLGRPLFGDSVTEEDFRCDAERVSVDGNGKVTKSAPPEITRREK